MVSWINAEEPHNHELILGRDLTWILWDMTGFYKYQYMYIIDSAKTLRMLQILLSAQLFQNSYPNTATHSFSVYVQCIYDTYLGKAKLCFQ